MKSFLQFITMKVEKESKFEIFIRNQEFWMFFKDIL